MDLRSACRSDGNSTRKCFFPFWSRRNRFFTTIPFPVSPRASISSMVKTGSCSSTSKDRPSSLSAA